MTPSREQLKQGLKDDQLIADEDGVMRSTHRWQAAMARAAYRLLQQGETCEDLRVPMSLALLDVYPDVDDDVLVTLVEIMLPLEVRALNPGSEVDDEVADISSARDQVSLRRTPK